VNACKRPPSISSAPIVPHRLRHRLPAIAESGAAFVASVLRDRLRHGLGFPAVRCALDREASGQLRADIEWCVISTLRQKDIV
jgi:hypothetical protein